MEKFNRLEPAQKIHATSGQCYVHAHQFWWVWPLWFLRYGYLSKTAKFPFWGVDYSQWSWKNSVNWNWLKKFMQLGVDVTCMQTSFGGSDLSGLGDMATFQKRPNFPFGAWTIVHGHGKIPSIGIGSKNSCNQGSMLRACTPVLVGVTSLVSEIWLPFKNGQISLLGRGL